jgi:hypothetical protein
LTAEGQIRPAWSGDQARFGNEKKAGHWARLIELAVIWIARPGRSE